MNVLYNLLFILALHFSSWRAEGREDLRSIQYLPVVIDVLEKIVELGLVVVVNGQIVFEQRPSVHIFNGEIGEDRWLISVAYLKLYAVNHPMFNGAFFLCTYDGWRELAVYIPLDQRIYVAWESLPDKVKQKYSTGAGTLNEPRFQHDISNPNVFPELPLPVLCYNRMIGDRNAVLIPDSQFLESNGFQSLVQDVLVNDSIWESKRGVAFWRGQRCTWRWHNSSVHPRDQLVSLSSSLQSSSSHQQVEIIGAAKSRLDAAFATRNENFQPIRSQLEHKFLIDVDGQVSAWSGLFWKLYSQSLVIRIKSEWEQWYHHYIRSGEHFVTVEATDDIFLVMDYCSFNAQQAAACKQVALQATQFVQTLTFEYAILKYVIH